VRQVGYFQELYRGAWSAKHEPRLLLAHCLRRNLYSGSCVCVCFSFVNCFYSSWWRSRL